MNSSIVIPEGWIVMILLFLFPYMIARKGIVNIEDTIHYYMSVSEHYIQKLINYLSNIDTNGDMEIK